jgi:hypothetical protein
MVMDGNFYRGFLTLALALGVATQAQAIPQLRLQSSAGADVTVADGDTTGPDVDLSSTDGVILFSGAIAGWNMNISSGFSKPFLGSAVEPWLDLNSANFSSLAGGTLNLWLTDTDFGPHSNGAHVLAAIGGTTWGNVTFRTFYDESNVAFGTAHEITSQSFSPLAFAGAIGGELSSATAYSLTMLVTLVHQGAQMTSFDATVQVPEPSSMLLLSAGLLGIGFTLRRRGLAASRAS